jgi:hypothetical protein
MIVLWDLSRGLGKGGLEGNDVLGGWQRGLRSVDRTMVMLVRDLVTAAIAMCVR